MDINSKADYTIMAALRGPDHKGCHFLKSLFTARIRALAGCTMKEFVDIRNCRLGLNPVDLFVKVTDVEIDMHWLLHIISALGVINEIYPGRELDALYNLAYRISEYHIQKRVKHGYLGLGLKRACEEFVAMEQECLPLT